MKIDLTFQQQRYSQIAVVFGNIRLCVYSRRFRGEELSNYIWVIENVDFQGFRMSLATSKIRPKLFFCRLSTDPKIHDLEWLWMAWMAISHYIFIYDTPLSIICYLLLIYRRLFLNIDQCMWLVRSGVQDCDLLNIWNPREKCRSFWNSKTQRYDIVLLIASLSFHWLQTCDFEWLGSLASQCYL